MELVREMDELSRNFKHIPFNLYVPEKTRRRLMKEDLSRHCFACGVDYFGEDCPVCTGEEERWFTCGRHGKLYKAGPEENCPDCQGEPQGDGEDD